MLSIHAWLLSEEWAQGAHSGTWDGKADKGMRPLLEHAARRLRKRYRQWDEAGAPERHRIRIAAKKARYGIEFFADLLPGREVRQHLRRLGTLQEGLGKMNDAAVAEHLLDTLGTEEDIAEAAAFVRGYLTAEAGRTDPDLSKPIKKAAKLRLR